MGSLSLFDDLSILKFHKRRVLIAVTVVFCEDGKSLLGAVLVNQPYLSSEQFTSWLIQSTYNVEIPGRT